VAERPRNETAQPFAATSATYGQGKYRGRRFAGLCRALVPLVFLLHAKVTLTAFARPAGRFFQAGDYNAPAPPDQEAAQVLRNFVPVLLDHCSTKARSIT
jgi:hypothetical protein